MSNIDLLIHDVDWIATMDKERRILSDGAIAINGDTITDIGKSNELKEKYSADREINAKGKLAIPGLIDTHVHSSQQLGRGLADECDISVHLLQRLYGYETTLMVEDAYWAALGCQLEMIRAGTTCFIDPGSYFPDQTWKAMEQSGMRGVLARTAVDIRETPIGKMPDDWALEPTDEAIAKSIETVEKFNGTLDGRAKAWFSLRLLSACSDKLIKEMKRLSDEKGVGLVMHACESRDEVVGSRTKYGVPEIERMANLGCCGPNIVLIHMGWASPKEIVLCMEHDMKVACTPSTGYRLAFGSIEFGRFPEMLELGITVALGSDGAMSSNYLDIVREMFLVSGGCKAQRLDPTIMGPEVVLEMGTLNGAKAALWEDEIGSLEIGKKADMAIFDTRRVEWRPVLNPIANLIYSSRGGADTVLCNGAVLMENGEVLTLDEEKILAEAQTRGERIGTDSGLWEKSKPKWPVV